MNESIGLKYTNSKDGANCEVAGIGTCTDTEIIIPASYNGKPVIKINGCAFDSCSKIEHIAIPDSITSIGARAFYACTSIQYIAIPFGVKSISNSVFENCNSLKSITIPSSVERICSYAFDYCKALTDVYYEGTDEQWSNITIGDGNDALTNANIIFVGEEIEDSVGVEYTSYYNVPNCYVSGIGDCTETDIVIGLNPLEDKKLVTEIDADAFYDCSSLTSVMLPPSITTIGSSAFAGCASLRYISMPDSVTEIGEEAFYDCSSLTSISIPSNVTNIGHLALHGCSSLISINVDKGNANYKSIDGNLYSKDGTTLIQYAAGKPNKSFAIPTGVTSIGNNAFDGCKNLKSIKIPSSVTSIGRGAFEYCISLTNITIPSSVTSICDWAFSGCTNLTSITIPESVISMGWDVFSGCKSLTIYCESTSCPSGWGSCWNDCYYSHYNRTNRCTVVWGFKGK